MNPRTLTAVFAAFLVLLALFGFTFWLQSREAAGPSRSDVGFSSLTEKNVDKVEVKSPGGKGFILQKSGSAWKSDSHELKTTAVDRFWKAVKGTRVGEVVSRNKANHSRFEVGEAQAKYIIFSRAGKKRAEYFLGKRGLSFESFYLRLPGSDEVRQASGELRTLLDQEPKDW